VYLLLQTVGVVAATVLVAKLIQAEIGSDRYLFSCIVVTAVFSLVLFFTQVDRGVRQMREERRTIGASSQAVCSGAPCRPYLNLTATEAINQVGARIGVNTSFVQWVRNRLRPGDSYYLVMTMSPGAAAAPQWITYRLLPHLATGIEGQLGNGTVRQGSPSAVSKADWVIFYDVDPRKWPTARVNQGHLERLSPTFALLRRRG
jgi:hypothetical protein